MENEGVLQVIILGVMFFGLVSLLIPLIPGIIIIWLAALVYGILAGFGVAGIIIFILLTIMMLGSIFLDEVIIGASAKAQGASWLAVLVATVAGVIGTFPAALRRLIGCSHWHLPGGDDPGKRCAHCAPLDQRRCDWLRWCGPGKNGAGRDHDRLWMMWAFLF
jgi:hypothetical protein